MNHTIRIVVCLCSIFCAGAKAAFDDITTGPRQASLGGAGSAMPGTVENLFNNPGSVVLEQQWQVNFYTARLYGQKELRSHCVFGGVRYNRVVLSAGFYTFGNDIYAEKVTVLGLNFRLNEKAWLGSGLRYASLAIDKYGSAGTFIVDVGGLFRVHPRLDWAWAVRNANAAVLGQCREKLPQIYVTGVRLHPAEPVNIYLDVCKDQRFPVEYRTGIEWRALPILDVRMGGADNPGRLTGGFTLKLGLFSLKYAYQSHNYLQPTHLLMIQFGK